MENFIEVYDNALTQDECESIVNWFEESEHIHQVGQCGEHEVRKDIKDSTDICIRMDEPWLPCKIIVLAWTLYLNDVEDGGETYYTYYDLKVKSKEGRLVIFPAYWTHAHKGIVSKTETKYIATGWFSFL